MKIKGVALLLVCTLNFAIPLSSQNPPHTSVEQGLPPAPASITGMASPNVTLCNCYYSTDCGHRGGGSSCQLGGGCLPQGKNDGKCSIGAAPPAFPSPEALSENDRALILADQQAILSAVDAYFQSFLKAIEKGGGYPDSTLLHSALDARLSQGGHDNVEHAVWLSLDAVMGWDFQYPTNIQRAEGFVGNIREVDGVRSASAIADATRRALLEAIKKSDTSQVAGPLRDFWSKHPNYVPNHLGRCYPHGHAEVRDMNAAVVCQIDVLQRMAGMLIDTVHSGAAQARVTLEQPASPALPEAKQ